MMDSDARILRTRLDFVDRLEQRGFERVAEDVWQGPVDLETGQTAPVRIGLSPMWPYFPPHVEPNDTSYADSWHSDREGGLCLYVDDDRTDRPWLDADSLLTRIAEWFKHAEAGWPDDAPDMDLERYFDKASQNALVLYDDLGPLLDHSVRIRPTSNNTISIVGPSKPVRKAGRRNRRFAYCADLGEPERPVKTWADIQERVANGDQLAKDIRDGLYQMLLLRYQRSGREGVIALSVHANKNGDILLWANSSASTSATVRSLRAGPDANVFTRLRVAVVGCGAVGSYVADGMSRAQIGQLTLQDPDVLRPGNLVRHLAGELQVGMNKADAVAKLLNARTLAPERIQTLPWRLGDLEHARELIASHDLVIDATSDGAATTLLRLAGEDLGSSFLSVCTQADGDVVRVDVIPPLHGAEPLPETPDLEAPAVLLFEGGCGDPVSPTPPNSVVEAAAIAVRHACALLVGQPVDPAGETRDYR